LNVKRSAWVLPGGKAWQRLGVASGVKQARSVVKWFATGQTAAIGRFLRIIGWLSGPLLVVGVRIGLPVVTLEPCVMRAGALMNARIGNLIIREK